MEWRFDQPQPDWKPVIPLDRASKPIQVSRTEDALLLTLTEANAFVNPSGRRLLRGGVYLDLPDWKRDDWAHIVVQARTSDVFQGFGVGFNLRQQPGPRAGQQSRFLFDGDEAPLISDGRMHTYLMRADWSWDWEGPWQQLGLVLRAAKPASIELLLVKVIPKEAEYTGAPAGVRTEVRNLAYRRTLYNHAPGKLEYRVHVPEAGHFDLGLGVLREDVPVTFRVTVTTDDGDGETVLEETYSDNGSWAPRSVDLTEWAGRTIALGLEAEAERAGTVALWAAPTLSGKRTTDKPNVIFYIIDAGAADFMSVYGYDRRNTPNLERLAAEGAIFEYAYSNSSWSKISTPSFMTSLHNSVLGGYKSDSDPLPQQAVTMAQRLHGAGYQTAVFTTNAYAGTMSSLDRGVDVLREAEGQSNSMSSRELHRDFWKWRREYPGEPYWVHFQTTDVHWPHNPVPPFAGLYVEPELRDRFYEWERRLAATQGLAGPAWPNSRRYSSELCEKAGVDRAAFFNVVRGLYDESMAHNDYQIGRMVERLKAAGEWEHTLFIVGADHGPNFTIGLLGDEAIGSATHLSFKYRIPMIVVCPERIAPGQRFSQPVSMVDMLPTILELSNLPPADVSQGQSLAPLLLGRKGWRPLPVILDEFYVDRETGELEGDLTAIDRRWIANLSIGTKPENVPKDRPHPLTLRDLWNNPNVRAYVNDEGPDLVEKYTKYLQSVWEEHQALAKRFSRTGDSPLTPEQLRTLRSLGYIQ
jgi:arylsulfatase A-like enzyme